MPTESAVLRDSIELATRTSSLGSKGERNALSGVGLGSINFHLHLVLFPAACFLSGEGFSVVAEVAGLTTMERGIVNLLPYPPLPRCD